MQPVRRATGPGRVNLIGDHTDYNLGVALPMAIGLGVTVEFRRSDDSQITVTSTAFEDSVILPLDLASDEGTIGELEPRWARLIGAMVALAKPETGGSLHIEATLPMGSGLSSSAALCVALAEVFGVTGSPQVIARVCQEAERRSGVPVGAMDPLVCAGGLQGHALLIEFSTLSSRQVALPVDAEFIVVESGQRRTLQLLALCDQGRRVRGGRIHRRVPGLGRRRGPHRPARSAPPQAGPARGVRVPPGLRVRSGVLRR